MRTRFTIASLVTLLTFPLLCGSRFSERARAHGFVRAQRCLSAFLLRQRYKIFDKHGFNVELIQMRSDLQLAAWCLVKSTSRHRWARRERPSPTRCRSKRWQYSIARRYFLSSARRASRARESSKVKSCGVAHRFGKPPLWFANDREWRRRPEKSDVHPDRQHDDEPGGAPTGIRQRRGVQPPVYGNDGGERVQNSCAKPIRWRTRPGSVWSPVGKK